MDSDLVFPRLNLVNTPPNRTILISLESYRGVLNRVKGRWFSEVLRMMGGSFYLFWGLLFVFYYFIHRQQWLMVMPLMA
jgi:hypothetical protein